VLNISENNIDAIEELKCLKNMTQFFVENNFLSDMKEMSRVLASWPSLWRLETTGNAFCNKKKYRDRVIIMSHSLGEYCSILWNRMIDFYIVSKGLRHLCKLLSKSEDFLNFNFDCLTDQCKPKNNDMYIYFFK
jgi:hypothetical protein